MSKPRKASEVPDEPLTLPDDNGIPAAESIPPAPDITHVPAVIPKGQHPLQAPEAGNILIATTFNSNTPNGRALLSKCYGPPHFTLATAADAGPLAAVDWCVYEGDVQVESGEIVRMPNVRLILSDGKILGWCSDVASEQFRRCVCSICGLPPYDPPVKFRVRRIPSKAHPGGSWYTFELVGESEVA